jgi:hypothetical protein
MCTMIFNSSICLFFQFLTFSALYLFDLSIARSYLFFNIFYFQYYHEFENLNLFTLGGNTSDGISTEPNIILFV